MSRKHILKIDIEESIRASVEDEDFTPEEIDAMAEKAKDYISGDDTFWNAFDSCINDAIIYVKHRREK